MKYAIFFLGLLIAGCSHTYNGSTKASGISVATEEDKGVFSSEGTVERTATSDYDDCLAKFANYPAREQYCKDWIAGGRPGQPAREYVYGGYYR